MPYNPDLSGVTSGPPFDPTPDHVKNSQYVLNEIKRLTNPLLFSEIAGQAYRVSKRHTLDDNQELILHVDPQSSGGTVHIETPAIDTPEKMDIDIWENAVPNSTVNDFLVHATRYDVDPETPEAIVTRVPSGSLDTTDADKTEETRISAGKDYNTPGGEDSRGLWRTIPVGETVSLVITDRSGGNGNLYGFDTMVYEGDILPD